MVDLRNPGLSSHKEEHLKGRGTRTGRTRGLQGRRTGQCQNTEEQPSSGRAKAMWRLGARGRGGGRGTRAWCRAGLRGSREDSASCPASITGIQRTSASREIRPFKNHLPSRPHRDITQCQVKVKQQPIWAPGG